MLGSVDGCTDAVELRCGLGISLGEGLRASLGRIDGAVEDPSLWDVLGFVDGAIDGVKV